MSDTVREQIAEIINDGTGGRVDMEQASSMSVIILSIVREAVSEVSKDYDGFWNNIEAMGKNANRHGPSSQAKVDGKEAFKKQVLEVLS